MPGEEKRVVVIGVGNLLLGDDGAGIHAINELKKDSFPACVKIVDGGTAGIDLLYWLEDAGYAVIIDCLEAGEEPGAIFRIPAEEIAFDSSDQIISLHDLNLQEVLHIANQLGKLPPTIIYGIQPGEITFNDQLSHAVNKALPSLINSIKKEINQAIKFFYK
ncbi:MAG: Hydrogenase 2 maturation protease [Pelotomaculum sp. PtaB.Bin013]|uniref:HyaD/HybD family hydrogenase maturation endopeptidase n=1 Tax=Pelotomaculum isophthalicicum JI TaxID=947010 RepID=A0A9X4H369_9FIRM|nr:HyaD/HybD family hydrogenase maturation endopeptidase [Pelotomaculum isophthalicicum]MDF9409420.1 HyaD/HybD family hydrogenase maturation endopeptidase [Pelotomaculum isophthalicicum JI]OPX90717.1 MAG: Hydrogenase 2 maturation protease [Pelotomaculum sp. PtaB.Bin013]